MRFIIAFLFAATTACPAFAQAQTPNRDMTAVLNAWAALKPKPVETLSADEARAQPMLADAARRVMESEAIDPDRDKEKIPARDIVIPGGIPARIYFPKPMNRHEPQPVAVYFHDGGFVLDPAYDPVPRRMAETTGAIIVAVDVRLAPEHKFPAAQDDALAAYKWIAADAGAFGGDAKRIALTGIGSGGNLALNAALAARDAQLPMPVCLLLVSPVAGTDMNTASYREEAQARPIGKAQMEWFFKNLVAGDRDLQDARLDIVGKADLRGLPPATLIAAAIDPLRSEDEALAEKLKAAGVKLDAKTYDGVTHGFYGLGAVISKADDAETRAANDLKAAFGIEYFLFK